MNRRFSVSRRRCCTSIAGWIAFDAHTRIEKSFFAVSDTHHLQMMCNSPADFADFATGLHIISADHGNNWFCGTRFRNAKRECPN